MPGRKKSSRKKRPIAVTFIAVAMLVLFSIRLYQSYQSLFRLNIFRNGIVGPLFTGWNLTALGIDLFSSLTYSLLSIAGLIVLIGLLRQRRWSWLFLMTWTGISLIISLLDYFYSHPNYAVMASNVLIAFALNIPVVRQIYGIRNDDGSSL